MLGAALMIPGAATPAGTAAVCEVAYRMSAYTGGFTAGITVLNIGTETINGWTFRFPLDATATVVEIWNAVLLSATDVVTTRDKSWNAVVPPGNSITIGFRATGASATPSSFTVNDLPCRVAP
ncbi:hypothetical protein L3i22_084670 [Actinoplanes sp. L3-i22]|nr:hypothetical protein L3i22_084670 [Actinoplanes sp. L3-i22]